MGRPGFDIAAFGLHSKLPRRQASQTHACIRKPPFRHKGGLLIKRAAPTAERKGKDKERKGKATESKRKEQERKSKEWSPKGWNGSSSSERGRVVRRMS